MALLLGRVLLVVFAQVLLNALIVAYIKPFSPIRLAVLPLIVLCVYNVLPICLEATGRVIWAALLGAHSIAFLVQYIDTALISQWSTEHAGPSQKDVQVLGAKARKTSTKAKSKTNLQRLRFGFYAAVSTRNVGTLYQVEGVPAFSRTDPSFVPSRLRFLIEKAITIALCYFTLDVVTLVSQPEQNQINFHHSRISLGKPENWSFENLIIRTTSILGFWISLYCIINIYMGSLAWLAVVSRLSDVRSWPPGFGSLWEAYTVRRFWGIFWHKYQQQKMVNPATYLTHKVLRMPRRTLISRYTKQFLTFLISGCIHALTEIAEGIPLKESGALRFFCTQVAGIAFEDGAQAIYGRLVLQSHKRNAIDPTFWKWAGYIWTTAFLIWSTPVWIYPSIYQNRGEEKDLILPVSIIDLVYRQLLSAYR